MYCARPDDEENNTDRIPARVATKMVWCIHAFTIEAFFIRLRRAVGPFNCKCEWMMGKFLLVKTALAWSAEVDRGWDEKA